MTTTPFPPVTLTAGTIQRRDGITGPLLKMHDGAVYISMSAETAKQWLPIIQIIATEGTE
jgi:hypothetical protein